MRERVLLALLLESCIVADNLREALAAAAKLLKDCNCQRARKQESLAAVGLASAALDRLERFNREILKVLPADDSSETETIQ